MEMDRSEKRKEIEEFWGDEKEKKEEEDGREKDAEEKEQRRSKKSVKLGDEELKWDENSR